ncbi:interleukin-1 receptor type 2-like [Trichomycterus rosablanca]|uniref:interleukin-1 receptor type 2-like n=1 Tax=Trichomycterus rosablanca TaxID=2290929 RepID=UPI002F358980
MTRTRIPTGPLSLYTGSALLLLCLSITAQSNFQVTAPKIVAIEHKSEGQCYSITCKVKTNGFKEETMVYWLANSTFVERAFRRGRVMAKEKTSPSSSEYLQTELVFTRVLPKDLVTNFTCIALNPAGFDKKITQIMSTVQRCRRFRAASRTNLKRISGRQLERQY